jgi:hypothetical protein
MSGLKVELEQKYMLTFIRNTLVKIAAKKKIPDHNSGVLGPQMEVLYHPNVEGGGGGEYRALAVC